MVSDGSEKAVSGVELRVGDWQGGPTEQPPTEEITREEATTSDG